MAAEDVIQVQEGPVDLDQEDYLDRIGVNDTAPEENITNVDWGDNTWPRSRATVLDNPFDDPRTTAMDQLRAELPEADIIEWANGDREPRTHRNNRWLRSRRPRTDRRTEEQIRDFLQHHEQEGRTSILDTILNNIHYIIRDFCQDRINRNNQNIISLLEDVIYHYLDDLSKDIFMRYNARVSVLDHMSGPSCRIDIELPNGFTRSTDILLDHYM